MDMPSRSLAEPLSRRRRVVGGVVVHDRARFEFGRDMALDLAQEAQEPASAMTRIATPDDLAGRRVQSREQEGSMAYSRRCAARFDPAHGKSIQRLNLALLVGTQSERAFGWRHEKADNIGRLLDKQVVGERLERLGAMGLKIEGLPDPMNRRFA